VLSGGPDALAAPTSGRPDVWPITVFEWGVIIFLLVWVSVVAVYVADEGRLIHNRAS
jgi:hypothetical protein